MFSRRGASFLVLIAALASLQCSDNPLTEIGRAPPASLESVGGDGQSATVGTELPEPLAVLALDDKDKPLDGALVNFVVTQGGGHVFAGSCLTNKDGECRERWTLGTKAGLQAVEARAVDPYTGVKIVYATFTAEALPDAVASLQKVSGDSQSAEAGTELPDPLVVKAFDQYGNPVPEVEVTWSVTSGGGSVNPTSALTDDGGEASTSWTLGSEVGEQTATATAGEVEAVIFTATASAAISAALQFDGAQGAETPDHDDLDLTSMFTIEAWMKPSSPSGFSFQTMIAKWGLSVSASYGIGFENDGRLHLVTHDPAQNPNNTKIFSSGALPAGAWQHLAFVFDNGQAWLYLDGVLDTSCGGALGNCWNGNTNTQTVPYMNTPQVTASLLTLGREKSLEGFIGKYYRGLLDDVRVWNVARSQSDIQADMNTTLTGSEPGLVAYWRMDEGSGDIAFDATGRGHHMQLGNVVGPDAADPTWVSPGK